MTQAGNSSYSEGEDRKHCDLRPAQAKSPQDLISATACHPAMRGSTNMSITSSGPCGQKARPYVKNNQHNRVGRVTQV
jgi:hypothetical protein